MNSGIQCISNTFELTEYFLNDEFVKDINLENPLGTQGMMVKEFAYMIKEMWYGSTSYVSP